MQGKFVPFHRQVPKNPAGARAKRVAHERAGLSQGIAVFGRSFFAPRTLPFKAPFGADFAACLPQGWVG